MCYSYGLLAAAIVAEVIATTALKSSDGFTRLGPSLVSVAGYGVALWLLSLTLRTIPTGVAYAVWSGVGVILIVILGRLVHNQRLDLPAMLGIGLILAGVIVMNLFSRAVAH